jgi:hypothetical protein
MPRHSRSSLVGVGVGVTHASFSAEVQSEIPQMVRIIGFFRLASRTQPQEPEAAANGAICLLRKLFKTEALIDCLEKALKA